MVKDPVKVQREKEEIWRDMKNVREFSSNSEHYKDDFDFHFMEDKSMVRDQLSYLGRTELDSMGFKVRFLLKFLVDF